MADWLGGLMTSWPTWLVGAAVIVFVIIAATALVYLDLGGGMQRPFGNGKRARVRRTKHAKK